MRQASGERISINRYSWGLDIEMHVSKGGKESGLCMYSGQGDPKAFGDGHRLVDYTEGKIRIEIP